MHVRRSLRFCLMENITIAENTVLKQVLEGMLAVHSKGIVHRDIKTDNILVGSANPPCMRALTCRTFACRVRALAARMASFNAASRE